MYRPCIQLMGKPRTGRECGFSLLESMMAILIVSFGVLGIMSLQSNAITSTHSANLRTEAGLLANEMIGLLWSDRMNLTSYALNSSSVPCASGTNAASAPPALAAWITKVEDLLPQAKGLRQSITVDPTSHTVEVTLCWREPQDPSPHQHSALAQIRG